MTLSFHVSNYAWFQKGDTVKTEVGKSVDQKSGGGASPFSQTVDDVPEKKTKSMYLKRG